MMLRIIERLGSEGGIDYDTLLSTIKIVKMIKHFLETISFESLNLSERQVLQWKINAMAGEEKKEKDRLAVEKIEELPI